MNKVEESPLLRKTGHQKLSLHLLVTDFNEMLQILEMSESVRSSEIPNSGSSYVQTLTSLTRTKISECLDQKGTIFLFKDSIYLELEECS